MEFISLKTPTMTEIDGFKEIDGTNTLFLDLYEVYNPMSFNIYLKVLTLPNGEIPTQLFINIADVGFTIIKHECYTLYNRRCFPNFNKITSYLYRSLGSIYICTIYYDDLKFIIYIDDEYPGLKCWGSKAYSCLNRAGISVGGKYEHIFYGYP